MRFSKKQLLQAEIFLATEATHLAREAINRSYPTRNECLFTKGIGVLMAIDEAKSCLEKHGIFDASLTSDCIDEALRVAKDDGQTPVVTKYVELKRRFLSFEASVGQVSLAAGKC